MSQADLHLKDLLAFYVDQVHQELLSITGDPPQVDTMFNAIKRAREIILVMSCMIGAVTPGDIEAIRKILQIKLVAENESAQMLRVGEDMALLRLWLKSASDPQWNVSDALRILRSGKPTQCSRLPEMTGDLLTSVKKPFVVPSVLPSNADSIRRILRASVFCQFQRAKREAPFVPERVTLAFNDTDDSVTISSAHEFNFRGIFDGRRWTIMEAQILDDAEGAPKCRQILQAISTSPLWEMCTAALRMATAQRLKQFQDEAIQLVKEPWSSVHSVSKSKTGLGHGFTLGLFKRIPNEQHQLKLDMKFDNGELIVEPPIPVQARSSLVELVQSLEKSIINETHEKYSNESLMVTLLPSGGLELVPTFSTSIASVTLHDWSKLDSWTCIFRFARNLSEWMRAHEPVLAAPTVDANETEITPLDLNETITSITNLEESVFVCAIKGKKVRLNHLLEHLE
jgi:hypothetical protein